MSLIVVTFLVPLFSLISLFHDIPPANPARYRVRFEGSMKAEKIIYDQSCLEAETITARRFIRKLRRLVRAFKKISL